MDDFLEKSLVFRSAWCSAHGVSLVSHKICRTKTRSESSKDSASMSHVVYPSPSPPFTRITSSVFLLNLRDDKLTCRLTWKVGYMYKKHHLRKNTSDTVECLAIQFQTFWESSNGSPAKFLLFWILGVKKKKKWTKPPAAVYSSTKLQ